MKQINVVGYECCDIVLYLAEILKELGETVAVVDLTERTVLYNYLPDVCGMDGADVTELRGVLYANRIHGVPETDCRIVVYEAGEVCQRLKNGGFDDIVSAKVHEWIFVTDEMAHNARDTESVYERVKSEGAAGREYIRIIRGRTELTREAYAGMLDGGGSYLFRIPDTKRDRKAGLHLSIRDDVSYRPLSERMSGMLEKIIYRLRPGTGVAEFERAYTALMKGGTR